MMLSKPNPASTTLYSSADELESHVIRFIMAEKKIERDVISLDDIEQMPEEILELNPCEILPVLFDRGMVLYDLNVIAEYLDERFPFPPLSPINPIEKAEKRILVFRFTRAPGCWFELVKTIINSSDDKKVEQARKMLTSNLIELVPLFAHQTYFKSDSMSIVDVCLAPILWRLKDLGIILSAKEKAITEYADRLFAKSSFKESLTDCEKEYN